MVEEVMDLDYSNSSFIEMNRPRQSWMIAGALLCSENVPRTRRERASAYVAANRVGCRELCQSALQLLM